MRYQFLDYRYDPERGLEGPTGRIVLRRSDARLLELLLEAEGRIAPACAHGSSPADRPSG